MGLEIIRLGASNASRRQAPLVQIIFICMQRYTRSDGPCVESYIAQSHF